MKEYDSRFKNDRLFTFKFVVYREMRMSKIERKSRKKKWTGIKNRIELISLFSL